MNNKRYLGAIGMVIGVALTWEAVQEANAMFMLEAILLTIAGTCYVFPVKNFVKKKILLRRNFPRNWVFREEAFHAGRPATPFLTWTF